jgi:hypothetical protein
MMMHNMSVPNSIWSCAVRLSIVVPLRKRTLSRTAGLSGGVPITLLRSKAPDAYKFRVFGCIVFAKVHDKLRRKLGEKASRCIMVGYPSIAPWYRVNNRVTRSITTDVHVVF